MVIWKLLRELSSCSEENGEFEARELFMHASGMTLTELMLRRNEEAPEQAAAKAREYAKRRASGEPLQYITGTAGFMGLEFEVNGSTLIPRQDTETLVEAVIDRAREGARILDIGTGSGCIGISLAKFVKNADVTLADISGRALETAGRNAAANGADVKLLQLDIMRELPEGKFDIIVSNPPYIRTAVIGTLDRTVKDHEPLTALDGGTDGLMFYRRITDAAPELLDGGGILAYEIGFDQGESVSAIVRAKFGNALIIKDLCGNDRVVIAEKEGFN